MGMADRSHLETCTSGNTVSDKISKWFQEANDSVILAVLFCIGMSFCFVSSVNSFQSSWTVIVLMSNFDGQSVLSWTIGQEFRTKVGRAWPGMMGTGGWQVELMSGSYQVMLVSPDPADLRCVGSHLYLPASNLVVSIPDPLDPFLVSHLIIILKHLHHHPWSLLSIAFWDMVKAEECIIIILGIIIIFISNL